jgi:hypothetical protein
MSSEHADIAIGRPIAEHARNLGKHPSALIRWIRRGRRLSDGRTIRLAAVYTPGGYRVTEAALAEFFGAITRDRLGDAAPAPIETTPERARRLATVDRELAAAGF